MLFTNSDNAKKIEIDLILEAIFHRYEYDFRQYSKSSLQRRIERCLAKYNLRSGAEMIERILYDPKFFESVLSEFSITVTEAFRDPFVFAAIRKKVAPVLKTYPFIKIWHAGCAGGEEVYSMAIILHEMGLLARADIYATDFNRNALTGARKGGFPMKNLPLYSSNYLKSGGVKSFSDYYTQRNDVLYFHSYLRERISFVHHNLVHDKSFGEMHLIFCRNVLIYFDRELQIQVVQLFGNSLVNRGFLCLGAQETIKFIDPVNMYEPFFEKAKIYRRKNQRGI